MSFYVKKSIQRIMFKPLLACSMLIVLSGCSRSQTYEFRSCEPDSKVINVMHVPRGFQAATVEDKLIRDDEPIHWLTKDPLGESWIVHNSGFYWTVLYTTYPEFGPLGSTPWRDLASTEDTRKKVEFGYIKFAYGQVTSSEFLHDPNAKRKNIFERIREDSVDGKYWVYPPHDQRTSKSTGRPTYFMPKDTGINVTIGCKDTGVNAFPDENARCDVQSQFVDDPNLSCMHVGYRIQVKDIPQWREFDARVKQQIKSMITQRTHGYTGPKNKVEK